MTIIKINSIDRTADIDVNTITKSDKTGGNSSLDFRLIEKEGVDSPEINDIVELTIDGEKEFAGTITRIEKTADAGKTSRVIISCVDYTSILSRYIATERYRRKTVREIIEDLIDKYGRGFFTINNVNCDIMVQTIVFDKISLAECLNRLSELTNYSWYVDYDKDINFFEKYDKLAPFSIRDDNGSYIQKTLNIVQDSSQLRNRVMIRGGEVEGNLRTETYSGNGINKTFSLVNKFGTIPEVKVNGELKTVGIDYLDAEESFDCFWSFGEKYVRFKEAPPTGEGNILISGRPLYPIIIQVQDDDSVDRYGVIEFFKEDRKIKSIEEAKQFAEAELQAYSEKIYEASFTTDKTGLRAGMVININSESLGVNEDFLIQSVYLTYESKTKMYYDVRLATLRTLGIIDFLIRQLRIGNRIIEETIDEVLVRPLFITEQLGIKETNELQEPEIIPTEKLGIYEDICDNNVEPIFVYAPYFPTGTDDQKVKSIFNTAKWQ